MCACVENIFYSVSLIPSYIDTLLAAAHIINFAIIMLRDVCTCVCVCVLYSLDTNICMYILEGFVDDICRTQLVTYILCTLK